MSITATVKRSAVPGANYAKDVLVALDNSYPNPAGYTLTPATFGLTILKRIVYAGAATLAAGAYEPVIVPTYDTGNGHITSAALHLIDSTTGAEVANAVDVHTSSLLFYVEGV